MTTGPRSQCSVCKRFRSPFSRPAGEMGGGPTCEAFPAGIPDEVYGNELDHRRPIDGDHGVRWESDGRGYPEYAVAH